MTIIDNTLQDYNEQKTHSDHTHDEAKLKQVSVEPVDQPAHVSMEEVRV